MKAEQECQQRKSQQTQPEASETSGEGPSTSILKVKSQKGKTIVVLLHCGCLSSNPFIEFRIWNNSSSSDVLYIQASISISPKYKSKSKTTSHCHLLLHDCTNVAV